MRRQTKLARDPSPGLTWLYWVPKYPRNSHGLTIRFDMKEKGFKYRVYAWAFDVEDEVDSN